MGKYLVPFSNTPNHSFRCVIPVDGENRHLQFFLHYNQVAAYWVLDIADDNGGALVTGLPLLTGVYPAENLLEQYAFLGFGSAAVVPIGITEGEPGADSLGSTFYVVWSDTI